MDVAVVDYRAGNLPSVIRALAAAGATSRRIDAPDGIQSAEAIVVPGVGHFDATRALGDDWRRAIIAALERGTPVLGICLGMQWLFEGSDEAPDLPGLGVFAGRAVRLAGVVKVPHVGWNRLTPRTASCPSPLLDRLGPSPFGYFTHSFAVPVTSDCVAATTHGSTFSSIVANGCAHGVQFHPEKSGAVGLRLLANFLAVAARKTARC